MDLLIAQINSINFDEIQPFYTYLSSGMKCAALHIALNTLGIQYSSFSSLKNEHSETLCDRIIKNRLASCNIAFQVKNITRLEKNIISLQLQEQLGFKPNESDIAMYFSAKYMSEKGYAYVLLSNACLKHNHLDILGLFNINPIIVNSDFIPTKMDMVAFSYPFKENRVSSFCI